MQRIIKFRAKTVISGDHVEIPIAGAWVYGFYVESKGLCKIVNNIGEFVVQKPTVGQFTGRKDGYEIDIYEGDIIERTISGRKEINFVEYSERNCMFNFNDLGNHLSYWDKLEIIGDIHSNPELLKEAK